MRLIGAVAMELPLGQGRGVRSHPAPQGWPQAISDAEPSLGAGGGEQGMDPAVPRAASVGACGVGWSSTVALPAPSQQPAAQ